MSTGRRNPLEPQQLETAPSPPRSGTRPADDPKVDALPGLAVAIGRALGTVVVTAHGELNATTSAQLAEVLRDLIDDQGNLSVVVDAHDLTLNGPEGAAAFTVAAQWAHRHGGTLALAHASEPLRRALHDGGVHEVLRFAD